jgi:hypothetical protein
MKKAILRGVRSGVGVATVAVLACTLAGCFDVQESVSLGRDLSGKAGFSMTVDMEPMLQMMAEMQHGMSGQTGPVTPEEMAKIRRDFLAKQKTEADPAKEQAETAARKAQLGQQLPAGVKLLSASVENQELKVVVRMEFGFDDIRKLAQIDLPQDDKAVAAGPGKNPYSQPFSGLKVTDEGSTLLVTMSGADPASRVAQQNGPGPVDAATQQQIAAVLKNARFAFSLASPFEVVTTNATRRDGHTLYWELKLSDAAAGAKLPDTLMARLKK